MEKPNYIINDFSPEEITRYKKLAKQVKKEFPYVIAVVFEKYKGCLIRQDYGAAIKPFVNIYEVSIQYLSSILIHQILKESDDPEILKKPAELMRQEILSIGHWFDIFLLLLKAGETVNNEIATRFLEKFNKRSGKRSKFGTELMQGIPNFRNKNEGHDTYQCNETAYKLLEEKEVHLFEFLEAISCLKDYVSLVVLELDIKESGNEYIVNFYEGGARIEKDVEISTDKILKKDHYYIIEKDNFIEQEDGSINEDHLVSLVPFLVNRTENKDDAFTYIFQSKTNKDSHLSYISPDGREKLNTPTYTQALFEFLNLMIGKEIYEKSVSFKKPKPVKGWTEYLAVGEKITNNFIGQMSSKYDEDLYVPRKHFEKALSTFITTDDKHGLVLLGGSGSGKTCILCHMANEVAKMGHVSIIYYSKIFSKMDLAEHVLFSFDTNTHEQAVPDLLTRLNTLAEEKDKKIVFFFDAINECIVPASESENSMTPAKLIAQIDSLLVSQRYPHIKVIMSCRNYTWEESKKSLGYSINPQIYFTTKDFSGNEEADDSELCLKGYNQKEFEEVFQNYGFLTTLEQLGTSPYLQNQLRDPFLLNLVAKCFAGKKIPQKLDSVSIMEQYIKETVDDVQEKIGADDDRSILFEFTRLLRSWGTDSIELNLIRNMPEDTKIKQAMFKSKSEFSTSLNRLLDLDILRIEIGTCNHEIRFVYERFHEFLLAKNILADVNKKPASLHLEFFEEELQRVNDYAVSWGAIRNAIIMSFRRNQNASLIVDLCSSGVYGAQSMIIDVLSYLAEEDYEACFTVLEKLIETPPDLNESISELQTVESNIKKLKNDLRSRDISETKRSAKTRKLLKKQKRKSSILNQSRLNQLIFVKNTATKILYDIYRSEVFVKNLYPEQKSPVKLLWDLLGDPLEPVRNCATRHIYYLWTEYPEIAFEMLKNLTADYLDAGFIKRYLKEHRQKHLEPSITISGLILCDSIINENEEGQKQVVELKEIWQRILRTLSLNWTALPVLRPIVKRIFFKAGTVISEYVNNIIEYQHFWDEINHSKLFSGKDFQALIPFLNPDEKGFEEQHTTVIKGASTGDAFSNFLIERVLIAQGVRDFSRISDLVEEIFYNPDNVWPEYTQMSMLYVIFHTLDKMESVPAEPFEEFGDYMLEWTDENLGFFQAYYNKDANNGLPYKQFTLNWYGALHSKLHGDGSRNITMFEDYFRRGFDEKNTRMFVYALDNTAMLASDFGYWRSALKLFEFSMSLFKRESDFARFKIDPSMPAPPIGNKPHSGDSFDVKSHLAKTLATIRGYFGTQVDRFVQEDLATTSFPNFESFRDELMRFDARENLGDLMTHKFGNLWVFGIVNNELIRTQVQEILRAAPEKESATDWLNWVASHVINEFRKM